MTNEQLLEDLARAIIIARDGKRDGERRFNDATVRKAYLGDAKAVIDHLSPMIRGVVEATQNLIRECHRSRAGISDEGFVPAVRKVDDSLFTIPVVWRSGGDVI